MVTTHRSGRERVSAGMMIGIATAAAGTFATAVGAAVTLARKAVTVTEPGGTGVTIHAYGSERGTDSVWLSGDGATLPGNYSFVWNRGTQWMRVGAVLSTDGDFVCRELLGGEPAPAHTRGALNGWWYHTPEALGLRTEHITYDTELGPADAWIIHPKRAKKRRWAVHVHGRGALPAETLRGVLPCARAGITSLIISYRNDPGAPAGHHERYGLGVAEHRDVDAAVGAALSRGAERVTLVGWSMGGTAALLAAAHGTHCDAIDGLILDSPALDWPALLRHHGTRFHAPQWVTRAGVELLQRGIVAGGERGGIPISTLTPAEFARTLTVPVLVHASSADRFVPAHGAAAFAAARPELVQLRLSDIGEHVRIWNTQPEAWERASETFLRALPQPGWRGPRETTLN